MPVLTADGLVLRPFRDDDVALVREAGLDPHIPVMTTVPAHGDTQQARDWIERQHRRLNDGVGYSFCLADASSDVGLGHVGLWPHHPGPGRASVGYWVGRNHRGAGIATRGLRAVSSWGLDHPGLDRLELYVEPWNEGSWRAAERVGYRREGLLRRWEFVGDERRDMFMYSLLPGD